MRRRPGRLWRIGLISVWALLVARITLTAGPPLRYGEGLAMTCVVCGSRGLADAVLNVVLFIPLGWVASVALGWRRAVLSGFLLSLVIETAQMYVPGRSPTLGDLIWNTAGAAAGALLVALVRSWTDERTGPAIRGAPAALGLAYLLLAGVLLHPVGTGARYFGQWTADLGNLTRYEGELLSVRINGDAMPSGPWPPGAPSPDVGKSLDLRATVVRDIPRRGLAPIASVYDGERVEILMLGASREDLFFRQRTRATALGLDYPEVRLWAALEEVAVGDTMTVAAWRDGREICMALRLAGSPDDAQRGGDRWLRQECGLGITPGRSWALLMNLESASRGFRNQLDRAWMATLFLLAGAAVGGGRARAVAGRLALVAVGAGAAVVVLAAATPLVQPPPGEWAGLFLGLGLGALVRPGLRVLAGVRD